MKKGGIESIYINLKIKGRLLHKDGKEYGKSPASSHVANHLCWFDSIDFVGLDGFVGLIQLILLAA